MLKGVKLSVKLWGLSGLLFLSIIVVALNSIWSINGMLSGNKTYAEVSTIDTFMVQKEVDHLKWVTRVKDLFLNRLDQTDVQLDPTKCGLGRFIYGEEGRVVSASDPELASLLETLKAHHVQLHDSAGLIIDNHKSKIQRKESERPKTEFFIIVLLLLLLLLVLFFFFFFAPVTRPTIRSSSGSTASWASMPRSCRALAPV